MNAKEKSALNTLFAAVETLTKVMMDRTGDMALHGLREQVAEARRVLDDGAEVTHAAG